MRSPLTAFAFLAFTAAGPAQAATCFTYDPAWQAGHAAAQTTLNGRVELMGTNLARERALTLEALLSATKVYTKQTSVNGERTSSTQKSTQEAVAATVTTQTQREALVRAVENYSPESGQGVQACKTVALLNQTVSALDKVPTTAKTLYTDVDVSPGKATTIQNAVQNRRDLSKADASVLLDRNASDEDRKAVIMQLAGLPMPLPNATTPGAEADLMMAVSRRVEALRSPALVSLAAVRAMYATGDHASGSGSSAESPIDQLDNLIKQYGGGDDFEKWSAGLAAQSERGLLIELARLRSMTLRLRQTLIEQQSRNGALFATMLAAQTGSQQ